MDRSTLRPLLGRYLARWGSVALLAGGSSACGGQAGNSAPPDAPAPAVAAGLTCNQPDFFADALAQVNAFRSAARSCGSSGNFAAAPALAWNEKLTAAAAGHSQEMAALNYFSHTSRDGRQMQDRITAAGYTWSAIGENIAAGQVTVSSAMTTWQNSAGHCANLMNPAFTHLGLACVAGTAGSDYGTYWTMDLARP